MSFYEDKKRAELYHWKRELLQPPNLLQRTSKKVQTKINDVIPEKVHHALTAAVRGIVKSVLVGMEFVPKGMPLLGLTLEERDARARELLATYKKIAAAREQAQAPGDLCSAWSIFQR